jgi:hypothetical protein
VASLHTIRNLGRSAKNLNVSLFESSQVKGLSHETDLAFDYMFAVWLVLGLNTESAIFKTLQVLQCFYNAKSVILS